MKELKREMKEGVFKRVYLFFGAESYLLEKYESEMKEAIVSEQKQIMNFDIYTGKTVPTNTIFDAANTLPFMSEYRLVIVKDSNLFTSGRKDETETMADFLSQIPESTVLIFIEQEVDKRNRLYKKVNELGRAVEFTSPTEKDLISWVQRLFKDNGKEISQGTAILLLRTVSADMQQVTNEMSKLVAYKHDGDVIEDADIYAISTKTVETKIFDLVGAVGNKQPQIALDIFSNLLVMKESPIMVISMIARQFRFILQCKELNQMNASNAEIATTLSIKSFIVGEYLKQGRNFSRDKLISAIESCLLSDIDIKIGKIDGQLAVELLIVKYS